jgi:hypothetical protein
MLSPDDVGKLVDALNSRIDQVAALQKQVADLQAQVVGGAGNSDLDAKVAAAIRKNASSS